VEGERTGKPQLSITVQYCTHSVLLLCRSDSNAAHSSDIGATANTYESMIASWIATRPAAIINKNIRGELLDDDLGVIMPLLAHEGGVSKFIVKAFKQEMPSQAPDTFFRQ
jgi:hypothetical protein